MLQPKCVAALVVTQSHADALAVVKTFSGHIGSNSAHPPHQQTFALLAIGEIGKHV